MKRLAGHQQGFTLPELLAVVVLVVALFGVVVLLLHPRTYATQTRDAERRVELATLAQSLVAYKADTGAFPADIPTKDTGMGTVDGMYDMCLVLVPEYLPDIVTDPVTGERLDLQTGEATDLPCDTADTEYITGYTVRKNKNGTLTLGLEKPETQKITITTRP